MFPFRKKFHLIIVCTANRTRSAYLAGYLNHYLAQYRPGALKRIKITSAGIKAAGRERVNDVVALIARKNGFNLRSHTAKSLSNGPVKSADLILVMEQMHKEYILEKYPAVKEKVFRLMEYGYRGDEGDDLFDVPDPTGKTTADFKTFIETAHVEADRLVHEFVQQGII
ncbi:MAG: low molecular weight protein-tyrosine phosphatase [Verrucomicrobiota bacterium]|jgi:protein-tyrosine-phosphatase|nr:low molecular weight protein-tyrosine phosphatase [Verrucomicrobiota bacterium]